MPTYSSYQTPRQPEPKPKHHRLLTFLIILLVLAGGYISFRTIVDSQSNNVAPHPKISVNESGPIMVSAPTPTPVNHCAGNTEDKLVLVSISKRRMWACEGPQTVYDSPVITGIEYLAADLTPTGTYHVYGKITNTTLSGHDSTGSWNDPVSYWMPFLHNQYGTYGFHDATWRDPSAFGNIDSNSSQASHGCVELPLATAKWLYGWGPIGLTVTIIS